MGAGREGVGVLEVGQILGGEWARESGGGEV